MNIKKFGFILLSLLLATMASANPGQPVTDAGPRWLYEQSGDPTALLNRGVVYGKAVSGRTELFYEDSSSGVIQITSAGALSSTSIPSNVVEKTNADTDYYVATTGTDVSTCGTLASPCLTRNYLYGTILPDMINSKITINIAAGTYYDSASMVGKLFGTTGTLTIKGATTEILADQIATGGDDEDANGNGNVTKAAAGWVVNAYAGKWVRFLTTTGPAAVIYYKYVPIISNTATILVTPRLNFTPTSATTFDVVSMDTILSGASAGAPNTAVNVPERVMEVTTSTNPWYDGLYYKYPLNYESLEFTNGYGSDISVVNSQLFFSGIGFNATDNSIETSAISSSGGATVTTVYGAYTRGETPIFLNGSYSAVVAGAALYGDYTTYSGGGHTYPVYMTSSANCFVSDYAFIGDAAPRINSAFYASGGGSYINVSKGQVTFSNNILRSSVNGYVIPTYSDKIFGNNNLVLYTSTFLGTIFETSQTNAGTTTRYSLDDTGRITGTGTIDNYLIEKTTAAKTVIATDTIPIDFQNYLLTAAGPITMTSTPTITAGLYDGQRKTLWGTSDTNTITLQDSANLAGSTLEFLGNVNRVLKADDKVDLYWDATVSKWKEINTTFQNVSFIGATGTKGIYLVDNQADALSFLESTNGYLDFDTTNTAEKITAGVNLVANTFASSGATLTGGTINNMTIGAVTAVSVKGSSLESTGGLTLAGTITGVTTAITGTKNNVLTMSVPDQGSADADGVGLVIRADDAGSGGTGNHVGGALTLDTGAKAGTGALGKINLTYNTAAFGYLAPATSAATALGIMGAQADGGGAVGVGIGSYENFVTAGSILASFRTNMGSAGGTQKAYVDYLGSFNAGPGTALLPAFSFVADLNTGIWNLTTDTIGFSTGGTTRASINLTDLDTTAIGRKVAVTNINAATYDVIATDEILDVSYTSTAAVTSITLPTAQMVKGRILTIKDTGLNAGVNNITIDTEGAEHIDGEDTYVMDANKESIQIFVNAAGTGWYILY
jgi:hypothetical protein